MNHRYFPYPQLHIDSYKEMSKFAQKYENKKFKLIKSIFVL
jgi:hypothetical protein